MLYPNKLDRMIDMIDQVSYIGRRRQFDHFFHSCLPEFQGFFISRPVFPLMSRLSRWPPELDSVRER
jgi:hypothetical protein